MSEGAEPRGADKKEKDPVAQEERTDERRDTVARWATRGMHVTEDVIYLLTALLLIVGALVVLGQASYKMISGVEDGVKKAIEATLDSLLIVFILVELLSAVRSAIADHELVAEPFLLVGILAAIKELVVLTTFRLEQQKTSDTGIKIGALAGVVIVLAFATFVLRRRQREPKESGD
jgi:uncharacterized membrane protein (DUF373 family)